MYITLFYEKKINDVSISSQFYVLIKGSPDTSCAQINLNKSNKAEKFFSKIRTINHRITFTFSHQPSKFMLAQFSSFSTGLLKDCYICSCCPQTDPVSQQSLGEVLTFHGVAAEAAGGADAIQPSTKAA